MINRASSLFKDSFGSDRQLAAMLLFAAGFFFLLPHPWPKGLALLTFPMLLLKARKETSLADVFRTIFVVILAGFGFFYQGALAGNVFYFFIGALAVIGFSLAVEFFGKEVGRKMIPAPSWMAIGWVTSTFLLMLILYNRALQAPVAFKGDGAFYMAAGVDLLRLLKRLPGMLVPLILAGYFVIRQRRGAAIIIGLLILAAAWFAGSSEPQLFAQARRYQPIYYVLQLLALLDPAALLYPANFWQEWRFALIPFLAVTSIAAIGGWFVAEKDKAAGVFVTLTLVTMPVYAYYLNLPYAELPALMLLTGAMLLFVHHPEQKVLTVLLLAVALVMKESVLIAVMLLSGWIFLKTENWQEKKAVFLAAMPMVFFAVYLITRLVPYTTSAFTLEAFTNTEIAGILGQALVEQSGLLVFAAIWAFGAQLRSVRIILLLGSGLLSIVFLYSNDFTLNYAGYSRHNLTIITILVILMVSAIHSVSSQKGRRLIQVVLIALILTNIFATPIDWRTGFRKPGWGDYRRATSEFDYPYRDLFQHLKAENARHVFITGRSYYYFDAFYLFQLGLADLTVTDTYAQRNAQPDGDTRFFVRHLGGENWPAMVPDSSFVMDTVFARGTQQLEVWKKRTFP